MGKVRRRDVGKHFSQCDYFEMTIMELQAKQYEIFLSHKVRSLVHLLLAKLKLEAEPPNSKYGALSYRSVI